MDDEQQKPKVSADRQPRVLVVDGNEVQLERISGALKEAGLKVVAVTREDALLPLYENFKPNVVVLATHAPEFTSIKVARRLQELSRGTVPFIYTLDAPDPELRYHCLEHGFAVDVVAKPLDLRELVSRVRAQVRLQGRVKKAAKLRAQERSEVLHDEVTGLYTKRALLAFIREEMRRGERYGHNFTLCCVRLNTFRAQQEVSRANANGLAGYGAVLLQECVRDADIVARVESDVFAVLLPQTAFEAATPVRERIAAKFEPAQLTVDGKRVRMSITLGVAAFPDVVGSPAKILQSAMTELKRAQVSVTPLKMSA